MLLVMSSLVALTLSSFGECSWFWMHASFEAGMDSMDALGFRCAGSMGVIIVRVWVLLVMGARYHLPMCLSLAALVAWTLESESRAQMPMHSVQCMSVFDLQFPMRRFPLGAGFRCTVSDVRWVCDVQFLIRRLVSNFFS